MSKTSTRVFDPMDGVVTRPVEGVAASRAAPGSAPKPKPDVSAQKIRSCLMCRTEFKSSDAGDRVCKSCRGSSAWRSPGLL